uniref:DUF481 domain-containing protein n=1 Tax=Ascaris lumbricoides TaxID=6252 RepID=A0A0M3I345_ASCLU
ANCSRSSSHCVVRFWFTTHVLTYDFCHDVGEFSYRVGYSMNFSDIAAITFGNKTVHLQVRKNF